MLPLCKLLGLPMLNVSNGYFKGFIFEMLNFNVKYFNVFHYFNLSLIFD